MLNGLTISSIVLYMVCFIVEFNYLCKLFKQKNMWNKFKILTIALTVISVMCIACKDKKDEPQDNETNRTIILYLIATNSLSTSIANDISDIEYVIQNSKDMNNCRLLVYYVPYSQSPCLYEIKKNKNDVENITIKTYSTNIKSTTVERMSEVLYDAIAAAPAKSYGLILGSHASGWANSLEARSNFVSPLDFGDDNGSAMPIHELAEAIPDNLFEFIYADACYMGGVEVGYELKNDTHYFIGSVTEIPIDGMDYINNIPCFLDDSIDLIQVCKNTYNKYNTKSGSSRTCTISLIDCSQLRNVASICKSIYSIGIGTSDYTSIQRYKRSVPYLFYDFKQYVNSFTADVSNEARLSELKSQFNQSIEKVVMYKATTPFIFNSLAINETNYSGLSTYIIGSTSSTGVNENYYKSLSWYRDVISK